MERIGGYRAGSIPKEAKKKSLSSTSNLPNKVDLRKFMTSIELQVGNSCVANAFAGAYEYLAKRQLGNAADVSRLFVYYNARLMEEQQDKDNGSLMVNAIEGLKEYGACAEEIWENDKNNITSEPGEDAYLHGANFKIVESEFIDTNLDLWRATLAEGYPIAFALNTFDSFDDATENRGRVPMPKSSDNVRETHGWHAMLCVGYSDTDNMFIVRNSWGDDWGDKGYCYIPYKYVIHKEYNGHDSWIIKSLENLEFDADLHHDNDDSYFAQEGMHYIEDFYVDTEEMEAFADALEKLCLKHVESEEDFYFDYEEKEHDDQIFVEIINFEIVTEDIDSFMEDLETLCQKHSANENYHYHLEGSEESEEEEEDEEE